MDSMQAWITQFLVAVSTPRLTGDLDVGVGWPNSLLLTGPLDLERSIIA